MNSGQFHQRVNALSQPNEAARPRGRPRETESDAALDAAVRLFWAKGYEGASISRLSRDMRLSKASMYDRFGDKEGLFLAAVARYGETRLSVVGETLGTNGSLESDLTAFFGAAIELATADPQTPGCLISCVLADAAGDNPRLRRELDARFGALEARLRDRLVAGQYERRCTTDPETLALMLACVSRGLMLRARAGAGRETLWDVARVAVGFVCR